MSNPKPDFPTIIKTNIPLMTKDPRNISPNSKRNTNLGKITFKHDISKPRLLSFLHSMYKSIKLGNYSSLNFKKRKESTNKLPHTPTKIPPQVARSGYSLAVPLVLILTQPGEGNSHLTGRERRILPLRVLIAKNLITLKSNISFFIEALDEFLIRQVKTLIIKIALEISILS